MFGDCWFFFLGCFCIGFIMIGGVKLRLWFHCLLLCTGWRQESFLCIRKQRKNLGVCSQFLLLFLDTSTYEHCLCACLRMDSSLCSFQLRIIDVLMKLLALCQFILFAFCFNVKNFLFLIPTVKYFQKDDLDSLFTMLLRLEVLHPLFGNFLVWNSFKSLLLLEHHLESKHLSRQNIMFFC